MFEPTAISRVVFGDGRSRLICMDGSKDDPRLTPFAGQVQAVYLDPPFMTGDLFPRKRRFGTRGWRTGSPSPTYPGYSDQLSRADYLAMLRGLLLNARQLLTASGALALHLDWRASARARLLCDEVFGEECFLNEIIWAYESGGRAKTHFPRKHDTILLYGRTARTRFRLDQVPIPRTEARSNHMKRGVDPDGRAYGSIRAGGREYRYYDDEPAYPGDVWTDISHLQQRDPERTGYATQKPMRLLERLLRPLVEPGDLVADLCCGSGTALTMAGMLQCRFLGVDLSPEAVSVCQQRLPCDDLMIDAPSSNAPALLEGSFLPESGLLTLSAFDCAHPAFPEKQLPLDQLEGWCVGSLCADGTLRAEQAFTRTAAGPELPAFALVSQDIRQPAILAIDAAGRRHGFIWR